MNFSQKILKKISGVFALLLITTTSAFAGGSVIVFGPLNPTAVPSLSSTMLIVLSLLLMVVAFRVAKNRESGSSKFLVALIGSALLLTGGGVKLVSDINANVTTGTINADAGQSFGVFTNQLNQYENNTTVPQEVKIIDIPFSCDAYNNDISRGDQLCRVGLVLHPNNVGPSSSCEIDCSVLFD